MKTTMGILDKIVRYMGKLNKYGEANLFLSQHEKNDEKHATLIVNLPNYYEEDEEEIYLRLRRLFKALEYRFNHDIEEYQLEIKLKRKE